MSEVWKPVVGFEGLYEVSDQGRVRSLDRIVRARNRWGGVTRRFVPACLLKPGVASHGYPTVALCGKTRSVHELVLTTFVSPRPQRAECRHLDGNRANPALVNLAWGTATENSHDKETHGTKIIGEAHRRAKLTDEAAREIKRLRRQVTQADLALMFGVSSGAVQAVHDGRTWRHV